MFLSGIYLFATNIMHGHHRAHVQLYKDQNLVSLDAVGDSGTDTALAVVDCDAGQTVMARTAVHSPRHDVFGDPDDRRSWFSGVLITII